ncbi:uncharacterized protein LOC21385166, partial [Morus notabilis]|uniref:uncharacterized protein LOC21385166 n=1 Tax=Morus notabilis TaxID=981085 RepID=UPI000CED5E8A
NKKKKLFLFSLASLCLSVSLSSPRFSYSARNFSILKPHFWSSEFDTEVSIEGFRVIHTPTATVTASASSQEKVLRECMETTRDVAAAAKIGKILAECLLINNIPAVTVHLKREQRYHGKVKAVIDSVREGGVKLI